MPESVKTPPLKLQRGLHLSQSPAKRFLHQRQAIFPTEQQPVRIRNVSVLQPLAHQLLSRWCKWNSFLFFCLYHPQLFPICLALNRDDFVSEIEIEDR